MTPDQLARATGASLPNATRFAEPLTEAMGSYAINTPARMAPFLAQISWESGRLKKTVEDLNYSAKRLTEVWPKRFPTLEAARPFAMNPEALANKTYGGRMGNKAPGDGWLFRGRGLKQLTGRENYTKAAAALWPVLGVDLLDNPDLVAEPAGAAWTAAWFWFSHGLNVLADRGDYAGITVVINGGMTGYAERMKALRIAEAEVSTWAP